MCGYTVHKSADATEAVRYFRRDYEILLRKVLALQKRPAVISLYWFSTFHHAFYDSSQDEMDILARCAVWKNVIDSRVVIGWLGS